MGIQVKRGGEKMSCIESKFEEHKEKTSICIKEQNQRRGRYKEVILRRSGEKKTYPSQMILAPVSTTMQKE